MYISSVSSSSAIIIIVHGGDMTASQPSQRYSHRGGHIPITILNILIITSFYQKPSTANQWTREWGASCEWVSLVAQPMGEQNQYGGGAADNGTSDTIFNDAITTRIEWNLLRPPDGNGARLIGWLALGRVLSYQRRLSAVRANMCIDVFVGHFASIIFTSRHQTAIWEAEQRGMSISFRYIWAFVCMCAFDRMSLH